MQNDLSSIETKIITALAESPGAMGLIDLMVASGTSYSSASVTTRVLVAKGLVERRHLKGGYVYRLTSQTAI